jgi:hypothetical protein
VWDDVAAVYWSPTLAWQSEEFTLYASGAIGSQRRELDTSSLARLPVRSLLFGATMRVLDPFAPIGLPSTPPRRR